MGVERKNFEDSGPETQTPVAEGVEVQTANALDSLAQSADPREVANQMPLEFQQFDAVFDNLKINFDDPTFWQTENFARFRYESQMNSLKNIFKIYIGNSVSRAPHSEQQAVFEKAFGQSIEALQNLAKLGVNDGKITPEDLDHAQRMPIQDPRLREFVSVLRLQRQLFEAEQTPENKKSVVADYLNKQAELLLGGASNEAELKTAAKRFESESERIMNIVVGSGEMSAAEFREVWSSISGGEAASLLANLENEPFEELFSMEDLEIEEQIRAAFEDEVEDVRAAALANYRNPHDIHTVEAGNLTNIFVAAIGKDPLIYGALITLITQGSGAFSSPVFWAEVAGITYFIGQKNPQLVESLLPQGENETARLEEVKQQLEQFRDTPVGEWLTEIDTTEIQNGALANLLDQKLLESGGQSLTSDNLATTLGFSEAHTRDLPTIENGSEESRKIFQVLLACRRNSINPKEFFNQDA